MTMAEKKVMIEMMRMLVDSVDKLDEKSEKTIGDEIDENDCGSDGERRFGADRTAKMFGQGDDVSGVNENNHLRHLRGHRRGLRCSSPSYCTACPRRTTHG